MLAAELENGGSTACRKVTAGSRGRGTTASSTQQLLTEGGDTRIGMVTAGGSNIYGCAPRPDSGLVALGSSTASVISVRGFEAADRLRHRLTGTAGSSQAAQTYARELDRVRAELLALCGLDDIAGLQVVIGASGTDLHLIAATLVNNVDQVPLRIIMVDAVETGSRVTTALRGCHFSGRAALGSPVTEGRRLTRGRPVDIVDVAIRHADGAPRAAFDVDAQVESLVADAAGRGWRSLVVLVDVSKTGMIAPSPSCVLNLRHRYADSLEVFVDACQFRITANTLRNYLARGFLVAVTGSKFVTGPSFSGALFIPPSATRRFRSQSLPSAMGDYCTRADWPSGWPAARSLPRTANFGLLLRWEAALEELRAFRSIPEPQVTRFLRYFADAVRDRLAGEAIFESLPVPALDRGPLCTASGWDTMQTIFPFVLYRPAHRGRRRPLTRKEVLQVQRLLRHDITGSCPAMPEEVAALRCQLGQPVTCGERQGAGISALRLCASARLVVEAVSRTNGDTAAAVVQRAVAALDKTAGLVRSVI